MLAVLLAVLGAIAIKRKSQRLLWWNAFPSFEENLFHFISRVNEHSPQTQQSANSMTPTSVRMSSKPSYEKCNNMMSVFSSEHLLCCGRERSRLTPQLPFSNEDVYHVECTWWPYLREQCTAKLKHTEQYFGEGGERLLPAFRKWVGGVNSVSVSSFHLTQTSYIPSVSNLSFVCFSRSLAWGQLLV